MKCFFLWAIACCMPSALALTPSELSLLLSAEESHARTAALEQVTRSAEGRLMLLEHVMGPMSFFLSNCHYPSEAADALVSVADDPVVQRTLIEAAEHSRDVDGRLHASLALIPQARTSSAVYDMLMRRMQEEDDSLGFQELARAVCEELPEACEVVRWRSRYDQDYHLRNAASAALASLPDGDRPHAGRPQNWGDYDYRRDSSGPHSGYAPPEIRLPAYAIAEPRPTGNLILAPIQVDSEAQLKLVEELISLLRWPFGLQFPGVQSRGHAFVRAIANIDYPTPAFLREFAELLRLLEFSAVDRVSWSYRLGAWMGSVLRRQRAPRRAHAPLTPLQAATGMEWLLGSAGALERMVERAAPRLPEAAADAPTRVRVVAAEDEDSFECVQDEIIAAIRARRGA